MKKIPVVRNVPPGTDASNSPLESYSSCRPLPASYMSEYTVIGLLVDNLERALEVLRKSDLAITAEKFGAEITIPDRDRLPEIVRDLSRAGVCCSIGDVIDSVYQG